MSSPSRALLLDAGFASLPFLDVLRQQGYRTAVCGSKNQDPGHRCADDSSPVNYGDVQQVMDLCREWRISALLPGVTDVSYLTGSRVAEQLGFPGFDTPDVSDTLFQKDQFRRWALTHHFPVPAAVDQLSESETLPLPLIVKPVDAYSGLGITHISERAQLPAAFAAARQASRSGEALIEQFIQGSLHSHSAFIRNGEIVCEFFVDEFCTVYPWQVNSSSLTTQLSCTMQDRVSDCLATLTAQLGLVDGLLHTQFMTNGNDFWLIELTRRCPGDLYSRLVSLSTGVPYCSHFVAPFIRLDDHFDQRRPVRQRFIARHTVSVAQPTRFPGFHFAALPAQILDVIPLKMPGDALEAAPRDRAGLVFAECDSLTTLAELTPHLNQYLNPSIQQERSL
ncbi:acetyl-CoA carboxylase biotin carboxylase subunit family protein [Pantoea sp.]|uniref:ATP-grasp domain-containing protein n=1 Tax=Pantoea sp. TaxID=69393 RepID=UPI0028A7504C|nr:ATP-grasp domain-containing protein [Pantoea sp.]